MASSPEQFDPRAFRKNWKAVLPQLREQEQHNAKRAAKTAVKALTALEQPDTVTREFLEMFEEMMIAAAAESDAAQQLLEASTEAKASLPKELLAKVESFRITHALVKRTWKTWMMRFDKFIAPALLEQATTPTGGLGDNDEQATEKGSRPDSLD